MPLYDFIELYLKIKFYTSHVCIFFLYKTSWSSLVFVSGSSSLLVKNYLLSLVTLAKREGTHNLFYLKHKYIYIYI